MMVNDAHAARVGVLPHPKIVVASNGYVIAKYHSDPEFRALIDQADIVDVDGMPSVFATKLLCRRPLTERVATTDFIVDACEAAEENGLRFFFLGSKPGVAQEAAANLVKAYPRLQIAGTRDGYFDPDQEEAICREIVASGADMLWLGMGSPIQERFAIRNRHRLAGLGWIRTCGGLFDFYSGRIPRAPQWMQRVGFEWMFRVLQEPRRLAGRYVMTNSSALYHLMTKTHD
jgi:exopolysaccharide biosynthesis WecB/TagA/CpsF family protein